MVRSQGDTMTSSLANEVCVMASENHEFLFEDVIAADAAKRMAREREVRERGLLDSIRAENERALAEIRAVRDENLAAVAALRAENDRAERLLDARREQEDRADRRAEEAKRQRKIDAIHKTRRDRQNILDRIQMRGESVASYAPEAYAMAPVDWWVVNHANPNDDSLPVNFLTTHPEYQEWRKSPAYDEFVARVESGEEERIDDSIDI